VERIIGMTDKDNEESVKRMYKILAKIGLVREIKKMGIKEGDSVVIGGYEFEWENNRDSIL
ncbi:MAG: Obg family GTPase CgtA, partial [Elusimicrobiales bacterium]